MPEKHRLTQSLKVNEGDTLRLGVDFGAEMRAVTLKRELTSAIVMDLTQEGQYFHLVKVESPWGSTVKIGTGPEQSCGTGGSLNEVEYLHVEEGAGTQDHDFIEIRCDARPNTGGVWVSPGVRGLYLLSEDYPAQSFKVDLGALSVKANLWGTLQGRTYEQMVEAAQLQEQASKRKANRISWKPKA